MHTLRIGNIADHGLAVGVHDDNVGGVRDVEAAGITIDNEKVPEAIAAERLGAGGLCSTLSTSMITRAI
jgi:hypothetical protein